jgi:fumarate reductase subunit C
MYRLAVKWLTFGGKATRKRLKLVKNALTTAFLTIGFLTFATYMKIGWDHRDNAGERYEPAPSQASAVLDRGEEE